MDQQPGIPMLGNDAQHCHLRPPNSPLEFQKLQIGNQAQPSHQLGSQLIGNGVFFNSASNND